MAPAPGTRRVSLHKAYRGKQGLRNTLQAKTHPRAIYLGNVDAIINGALKIIENAHGTTTEHNGGEPSILRLNLLEYRDASTSDFLYRH